MSSAHTSGDKVLAEVRERIIRLARIWDEESVEPAEDFADALLADLGLEQVKWMDPNHNIYGLHWVTPEMGPNHIYEPVYRFAATNGRTPT